MPFSDYTVSTPKPILDEDGLDTTSKFYNERKKILETQPKYYSNKLNTDYDRIKADADKDGYISKYEYETYIVQKEEKTIPISESKLNMINIDWTIITSVIIVCMTIVITTWIFKKKPKNP